MLDTRVSNQDCTAVCKESRRDDGMTTWWWPSGVNGNKGTRCDLSGLYKCATFFQQKHRARCV
ncbi:hypothetical protein NHQ30_005800 [Ciborinia camelliae]|nr:hypothetical protein NHQ30_005800 [Ciborinia camelliae]